jgi:hypothetical protein
MPEQLAPVGLPQVQAPQVRESLAPVFHDDDVVPVQQARGPSNIAHFGDEPTGTQTPPRQPAPTVGAAQKRIVDAQVTEPGLAVPCGAQDPVGGARNEVACTP